MKKLFKRVLTVGFALSLVVGPGLSIPFSVNAASSQGPTELASVTHDGSLPNDPSGDPILSEDGRYVYFGSNASNLVPNDTNNAWDIFVRDRLLGTTTRLTLNSAGQQADAGSLSGQYDVSDDGRYLVFSSMSSNLGTPGNGHHHIFLRDLQTGVTSLVYREPQGGDSNTPVISGDGNYVAFRTHRFGRVGADVYVYNRNGGALTRITNGVSGGVINGGAINPSINYDGSVVVYDSNASNLINGDTNGQTDVFLWDRNSNGTSRISVDSSGAQVNGGGQWAHVSDDGKKVVFNSSATNLVTPAVRNGSFEAYLRDLNTNTTTLMNVTPSGQQGNSSSGRVKISGDGNFVAFTSLSTNLVPGLTISGSGAYVRNLQTNTTSLVSIDSNGNKIGTFNGDVNEVNVSRDGRFVAFQAVLQAAHGYAIYWHDTLPSVPVSTSLTLVTSSPSNQDPSLSWGAVAGATSYNVYRNDTQVGSTASTTYTDTTAPEGTNTYHVTATNNTGEGASSNVVTAVTDRSAPTIFYDLSQEPNGADWNDDDVAVTFTCDDTISGVASCSDPVTVGEGASQTVTGTSVDLAGNTSTVSVTLSVDKTLPTISYTTSSASPISSAGWYKSDVIVAFECADGLSGLLSCSAPVTLSSEGENQLATGTAEDVAGNTNQVTAGVNIDKTAPVVVSQSFSTNPKSVSQTSVTLTAQVDDNLSGVSLVEYFDPVLQTWQPMLLSGSTATALVNTSFMFYPAGTYSFMVRAWDRANNQSQTANVDLHIYNPGGGHVTGTGFLDLDDEETEYDLPAVQGNNIQTKFDFNVKYDNPLAVVPEGNSTFSHGQACNSPNNACFKIVTDSYDWLIVPNSNDSAVFQGLATLTLAGQSLGSGYPVRVSLIDDGSQNDHYLIQVYPVGSNPDSASSIYYASGNPTGSVLVHP